MADTVTVQVILASGSPYRRKMLEAAGVPLRVVAAHVDEAALKRRLAAASPAPGAAAVAQALADAKAVAVSRHNPEALVIGADQVLALDGELFDKPADMAAARAQLQRLRGRAHELHSAAALAQAGEIVWRGSGQARLGMRAFSPAFLDAYLAAAGSRLCQIVGAYEIEGVGIQLFDRIEGDHFTIIGLPLVPLLAELRTRGVMQA